MKVEPDLAPGDYTFIPDKVLYLRFSAIVVEACVVRMCADGGVNILVLLTQGNGTLKRVTVRIAGPNVEYHGNAGSARALDHGLSIRVKLVTINMRMRVNKHSHKKAQKCGSLEACAVRDVLGEGGDHWPAFFTVRCSYDHSL